MPSERQMHSDVIAFVIQKMREWGVPEHIQKHVSDNWDKIKTQMRAQQSDQLTIINMQPLLKKYINSKLSSEEKTLLYERVQDTERATKLRQMTDRALLEAIYKKLHE